MKTADFLAAVVELDNPCDPAVLWLRRRVGANSEDTFAAAWAEALQRHGRSPEETNNRHHGRAWCSWLCARIGIQVREGVFSGNTSSHGPSVTALSAAEVEAQMWAVLMLAAAMETA